MLKLHVRQMQRREETDQATNLLRTVAHFYEVFLSKIHIAELHRHLSDVEAYGSENEGFATVHFQQSKWLSSIFNSK